MRTFVLALSAAAIALPAVTVLPASTAEARRHYQYREYRGRDGRVYCKKNNGTTGLVVGGVGGALLGRTIDTGGDRTVGTLGGAAVGGRARPPQERGAPQHPRARGARPATAVLRAAKAEGKAELDAARRGAPKVRGGTALIRFHSPTQIHPLVAQQWRGRLKGDVVLAATTGYRPGWVHFAVRTATDLDLIAWLADRRPPGADEAYGSGHRQATGGALRLPDWNAFVDRLGFPEERIAA